MALNAGVRNSDSGSIGACDLNSIARNSAAEARKAAALADGRALTATELAYAAGVSPQTTSEHLAKLREANLLALTKQGRHSYFRLSSPKVARMIESIMVVAADGGSVIGRAGTATISCAPLGPVMTTLPAVSAWRLLTHSRTTSTLCSPMTAVW